MTPTWVAPLVAVLVHFSCKESGSIFEASAGHYSKIRWERSKGLLLKPDDSLTPSALLKAWPKVRDFTNADHPTSVSAMLRFSVRADSDVRTGCGQHGLITTSPEVTAQ